MSFLKNLRRHREPKATETEIRQEQAPECAHRILLAQWDDPQAMGDESRANSYRCDACGEIFSRDEGESLRRVAAERTKETIGKS